MARIGPRIPDSDRGKRLAEEIAELHDLSPEQRVILEEACRCADRLDKLDAIIAGKGVLELLHFRSMLNEGTEDERVIVLQVDSVLSEARQQQTVFKQLLAALRLPDEAGKRPQQRGGARGAYQPSGNAAAGNVSSLDRARQKASGH